MVRYFAFTAIRPNVLRATICTWLPYPIFGIFVAGVTSYSHHLLVYVLDKDSVQREREYMLAPYFFVCQYITSLLTFVCDETGYSSVLYATRSLSERLGLYTRGTQGVALRSVGGMTGDLNPLPCGLRVKVLMYTCSYFYSATNVLLKSCSTDLDPIVGRWFQTHLLPNTILRRQSPHASGLEVCRRCLGRDSIHLASHR